MLRLNIKVGLLIVFLMTSACCPWMTVQPDDLITAHNIIVIPYKASPMMVEANHSDFVFLASFLTGGIVGGIVGSGIQHAATSDARVTIAEYMNKTCGTWNPSLATAEECLNILKNGTKVSISNAQMGDILELPEADKVRAKEPRTFTEIAGNWSNLNWYSVWRDFEITDASFVKYYNEHPQIKGDWLLEVFSSRVRYTDDSILLGLTMKLSNPHIKKKMAIYFDESTYDIPTLKEGYDFKTLDQSYRNVSQKACTKVLTEMGLY